MQNGRARTFLKAKKEYILRTIAGDSILVPIGEGIANFSGVIYVNDSAAFLWKLLQSETTSEQLEQALVNEFDISIERAEEDVQNFIDVLMRHNMLEA